MSRWFSDLVRRGGRVHHDGISPKLFAQLQRQVRKEHERREARRRRRAPVAVFFGLVGVVVALALAVGLLLGGR